MRRRKDEREGLLRQIRKNKETRKVPSKYYVFLKSEFETFNPKFVKFSQMEYSQIVRDRKINTGKNHR